MIEKFCEFCGNKYYVKEYRENKSRFCSQQCMGYFAQKNYLKNVDYSHLIGNNFRKGKLPINKFEKGHIPWNKDKKGIHLSPKTEFKKGSVSLRKAKVGSIKTRKYRDKFRNWIKVEEPNLWKLNAVYVWEENFGEVPSGFVVHHINKNSLDDRIENLTILSRKDHINVHREDLKNKSNPN